jgi:hypothetical protein
MLKYFRILYILSCLLLFSSFLNETGKPLVEKFPEYLLNDPRNFREELENSFSYVEIEKYERKKSPLTVVLENGYADFTLKNKNDWKPGIVNRKVTEIDIVFTKYPRKKCDWLTNFYDLLAARLKELFRMDPSLNNKNIKWRMVLQTSCLTAEETKRYFHGIVIRYELTNLQTKTDLKNTENKQLSSDKYSSSVTSSSHEESLNSEDSDNIKSGFTEDYKFDYKNTQKFRKTRNKKQEGQPNKMRCANFNRH